MNTQKTVYNLRLLADTIEELEIDNIIGCSIEPNEISCHLHTMKLSNADCIWEERLILSNYPWEKVFYHNNIRFFTLYTQEEYLKETK